MSHSCHTPTAAHSAAVQSHLADGQGGALPQYCPITKLTHLRPFQAMHVNREEKNQISFRIENAIDSQPIYHRPIRTLLQRADAAPSTIQLEGRTDAQPAPVLPLPSPAFSCRIQSDFGTASEVTALSCGRGVSSDEPRVRVR